MILPQTDTFDALDPTSSVPSTKAAENTLEQKKTGSGKP